MLGSMQLEAQVEQIDPQWLRLLDTFRGFSVLVVILTFVLLITLVATFFVKFVREWMFAVRAHYSPESKRRELMRTSTKLLADEI